MGLLLTIQIADTNDTALETDYFVNKSDHEHDDNSVLTRCPLSKTQHIYEDWALLYTIPKIIGRHVGNGEYGLMRKIDIERLLDMPIQPKSEQILTRMLNQTDFDTQAIAILAQW